MLSIFSSAKLAWMPSACYIPNYYMPLCVYLYLVPLLLHCIGSLLACVAASFVTSVSVVEHSWSSGQGVRLQISKSQSANPIVNKVFLVRGLFPFFELHFIAVFLSFSASVAKRNVASV